MSDYSDYPEQLNERRPGADTWSPREVLIDALRMIDRGEIDPESLVVIYKQKDKKDPVGYLNSTKNMPETIGMLEIVKCRFTSFFT